MAKGKHTTALFEVIHSKPRFGGKSPRSAMLTPKWWFKGRPKTAPRAECVTASADGSTPFESDNSAYSPTAADLDGTESMIEPAHAAPARDSFAADMVTQQPLGRSAIQLHFDRDRHELTLRLRYTTAIVTGFAACVALGLAYVLGRHIAGGPQSASAATTVEELVHRPTQPDVLDVGRRGSASSTSDRSTTDASRTQNTSHANETRAQATGGATDGHRVVHTNYLIVQSYPTEKSAIEARDFLNKAGIPCTAEKAPPGWTADANWYSVITTTGFQHPRGPEGDAYLRSIEKAGATFAGNSHFKRFEPHWYSWK